jgi:DNA-directed RNA polymerase subunit RPC12/RpoP
MRYELVSKDDWERAALYLAVGMLLIVTGAIFLFAINRLIGAILWFALIAVVLAVLVSWHTKTYAYRCKQCGEEFEISRVTNFVSPQGVSKDGAWKYLRCPRCEKHERAEVLKKVKQ